MLATNVLRIVLTTLVPVALAGLTGDPSLADPNVATTPLGNLLGENEPIAPLIGKRQTIGACATVGVRVGDCVGLRTGGGELTIPRCAGPIV